MKVMGLDGDGLATWCKRLEAGRYEWPMNPMGRGDVRQYGVDMRFGDRIDGIGFAGVTASALQSADGGQPVQDMRLDHFMLDRPLEDAADAIVLHIDVFRAQPLSIIAWRTARRSDGLNAHAGV